MGSRVSEFLGLGEDKFVTKEGDPDGGRSFAMPMYFNCIVE
jgi:hypothetical protein